MPRKWRFCDDEAGSVVRRVLTGTLGLYLLFALIGNFAERIGAVTCGCSEDCWCKKPGLSVFRWVFPRWHRAAWPDSAQHAAAPESP